MRRAPTRYLLAALCALGCESLGTSLHPQGPQWVHRPSGSLSLVYTRDIVADSRELGEPYERGGVELDLGHQRVFVGSRDRGLYAIRAVDGVTLWRFETLGAVQSEPLYSPAEDAVYFGSDDGAVYKVRAEDGTLIWRFATNAEVMRRPVLSDGMLFVVNANDTVVGINAETGALIWNQHRLPAMGMEIVGHASPLVDRGLVYCAFSDGTVTAFDARTGQERWAPVDLSAVAEQELDRVPTYLDVDTSPVAGEVEGQPALFVAAYEGGVFALSSDTGSLVWSNASALGVTALALWSQPQHPSRGGGPPAAARSILIASSGTRGLFGLNPENGEERWHTPVPLGGASEVVPVLGAVLFTTTKQGVFLASPLDGRIIDGIHTGAGFSMPPAAYGRRSFVVSNGGKLYSLHIAPPLAP